MSGSPGLVVRGSVRLPAALATRSRPVGVADLIPSDLAAWSELRRSLGRRQAVRALGRRFRRDPAAYLRSLEVSLINPICRPSFFPGIPLRERSMDTARSPCVAISRSAS